MNHRQVSRQPFYFRSLLLASLLLPTWRGSAQWSTDPANNLVVGYGLNSDLCSDSADGVYVAYENGSAYPRQIELRRLDRYGYQPWGSSRTIIGERAQSATPRIVADGRGGVVASYIDGDFIMPPGLLLSRVRVQRVDSTGNLLWGSSGVRVSTVEHSIGVPPQSIVPDGSGGCIVAWVDSLGYGWVNRIDSVGDRVWGDSGRYVPNSPATMPMISDYRGGCYIVPGGRLQRFDSEGNSIWPTPVYVPTGAGVLSVDRAANLYLLGSKVIGFRNGQLLFTVNLQKVDTSGHLLWDSLGTVLDTINANNPPLTWGLSLDEGFGWVCWPQQNGTRWDLRTQIVHSDGSVVFPFAGRIVSNSASNKGLIGLLPSDSSTALFVWGDNRTPSGIYVQRFDTLHHALLDTNDIVLSTLSMGGLRVVPDGRGGCIVGGWRETDFTVRAQQVNRFGVLGQVTTDVWNLRTGSIGSQFQLYQNYPNPFNPTTIVQYKLPQRGHVVLKVFDILGREVRTLVDETREAGSYKVLFEADQLAGGVYFYRLETKHQSLTRKLIVVK